MVFSNVVLLTLSDEACTTSNSLTNLLGDDLEASSEAACTSQPEFLNKDQLSSAEKHPSLIVNKWLEELLKLNCRG
jgi:hypothetical protein